LGQTRAGSLPMFRRVLGKVQRTDGLRIWTGRGVARRPPVGHWKPGWRARAGTPLLLAVAGWDINNRTASNAGGAGWSHESETRVAGSGANRVVEGGTVQSERHPSPLRRRLWRSGARSNATRNIGRPAGALAAGLSNLFAQVRDSRGLAARPALSRYAEDSLLPSVGNPAQSSVPGQGSSPQLRYGRRAGASWDSPSSARRASKLVAPVGENGAAANAAPKSARFTLGRHTAEAGGLTLGIRIRGGQQAGLQRVTSAVGRIPLAVMAIARRIQQRNTRWATSNALGSLGQGAAQAQYRLRPRSVAQEAGAFPGSLFTPASHLPSVPRYLPGDAEAWSGETQGAVRQGLAAGQDVALPKVHEVKGSAAKSILSAGARNQLLPRRTGNARGAEGTSQQVSGGRRLGQDNRPALNSSLKFPGDAGATARRDTAGPGESKVAGRRNRLFPLAGRYSRNTAGLGSQILRESLDHSRAGGGKGQPSHHFSADGGPGSATPSPLWRRQPSSIKFGQMKEGADGQINEEISAGVIRRFPTTFALQRQHIGKLLSNSAGTAGQSWVDTVQWVPQLRRVEATGGALAAVPSTQAGAGPHLQSHSVQDGSDVPLLATEVEGLHSYSRRDGLPQSGNRGAVVRPAHRHDLAAASRPTAPGQRGGKGQPIQRTFALPRVTGKESFVPALGQGGIVVHRSLLDLVSGSAARSVELQVDRARWQPRLRTPGTGENSSAGAAASLNAFAPVQDSTGASGKMMGGEAVVARRPAGLPGAELPLSASLPVQKAREALVSGFSVGMESPVLDKAAQEISGSPGAASAPATRRIRVKELGKTIPGGPAWAIARKGATHTPRLELAGWRGVSTPVLIARRVSAVANSPLGRIVSGNRPRLRDNAGMASNRASESSRLGLPASPLQGPVSGGLPLPPSLMPHMSSPENHLASQPPAAPPVVRRLPQVGGHSLHSSNQTPVPPALPGAAPQARQPLRRSYVDGPIPAAETGGVDANGSPHKASSIVEQLKPWEIEFLSAKAYSYLRNKLVIEEERFGRPSFEGWR